MTWTEHVHADPRIAGGKPVVKGTRLAVDFVLGLLAEGWSREQLRANFRSLAMMPCWLSLATPPMPYMIR